MTQSLPSFLCFDLETTSKHPAQARICQWATVTFSFDADANLLDATQPLYFVSSRHSALVDPGIMIPTEASRIHGVYDTDVISAPTTKWALLEILERLRGQIICGYNLVAYDLEVVAAECRRHGLVDEFIATMSSLHGVVDVMPWAARTTSLPTYRKGARTLQTMSSRHGVGSFTAHDACGDAEATGRLMLSLQAQGLMVGLEDAVEAAASTWQHFKLKR